MMVGPAISPAMPRLAAVTTESTAVTNVTEVTPLRWCQGIAGSAPRHFCRFLHYRLAISGRRLLSPLPWKTSGVLQSSRAVFVRLHATHLCHRTSSSPGLTPVSTMQAYPAAGIMPATESSATAAATSSSALTGGLTGVARAKAGMAPPRLGVLPR
ncbi:hypothetical protein E2562_019952 [Oryza meyeriana var. granulata]|uniref:Uncharacterized protein n=1 Tax=Oryza meyeriana var. granulata TaxID=110450 RepID=A0A6G1CH38_9ORYZ|nr:hypothetical protein E2562_019952 [Oryza meyeriana var. granulata]